MSGCFDSSYKPLRTSEFRNAVSNSSNNSKKQGHKRAHSASAVLYALEHSCDDL